MEKSMSSPLDSQKTKLQKNRFFLDIFRFFDQNKVVILAFFETI